MAAKSENKKLTQKIIHNLKSCPGRGSIERLPIIRDDLTAGYLRPIPSVINGTSLNDVFLFASWRTKYKKSFFTWQDFTEQDVRRWLENNYANNDREIIFFIETLDQAPLGLVSLYDFDFDTSCCAFGRLIRGEKTGPKGMMTLAVQALLSWAFRVLRLESAYLEVFEDNHPAVALYEQCGFRKTDRVPLHRIESADRTKWEKIDPLSSEAQTPDGYALRMVINRETMLEAR